MGSETNPEIHRRDLLRATVGAAGAVALAGSLGSCGESKSGEGPGKGKSKAHPLRMDNLVSYAHRARGRIPRPAFDFIAAGTEDEVTLRRNREAFHAVRLKPKALVDVSSIDTKLELFGQKLDHPVLLAPVAFLKWAHAEGEVAAARGAAAANTTFVVPTISTSTFKEIATARNPRLWFQLYIQRDRGFMQALIQKAQATGCRVLCVTIDNPAKRTLDRVGLQLAPLIRKAPPKLLLPMLAKVRKQNPKALMNKLHDPLLDPKATWETIDWIRSQTKMPVVVKGILSPEDAQKAVDHGVNGILVSNHGGRSVDTVPASIEALPRVVDAVQDRVPILLDSGVRRGTDVLKALAYGAKAVLIGRPYVWGLAVDGSDGVQKVVNQLTLEFKRAMAGCGMANLGQIDRKLIWT